MEGVRSPAQVFALVIGATLTVAGIVGFFYNATSAPATAPSATPCSASST